MPMMNVDGGSMKNLTSLVAGCVISISLLTGCSATDDEPPAYTPPPNAASTDSTPQETQNTAPDVSYDIPSEWNTTEKKIFDAYVLFYPETKLANLKGKRALMENAHLICQAYGEGYSRREILAAITGGAVSAQMSDDWMTLSVTYLCPEYFDQQRAD